MSAFATPTAGTIIIGIIGHSAISGRFGVTMGLRRCITHRLHPYITYGPQNRIASKTESIALYRTVASNGAPERGVIDAKRALLKWTVPSPLSLINDSSPYPAEGCIRALAQT